MSNESENRIDLTQFEGRTEGSWLERTGGNMARWIVRGQFLENDANEALICAAPDLLAELKRCYEELDRPKVTIDDWDKEGPCVTVYLEGKEYVGILREYDASE
jgi:hypothetical protein